MAEEKSNLTLYIVIAIVLAVITALIFPHFATSLQVGGEVSSGC